MVVVTAHRVSLRKVANTLEERPPTLAVDLINLAAQLYAADRSSRRGRRWVRQLGVAVEVADPTPWQAALPCLGTALNKLTDDEWSINLVGERQPLPEEKQPWLLKSREHTLDAVALFSGGLDSFAGAAAWLVEHPDEVLGLVSISSSTVTGRVQKDLAAVLAACFPERTYHLLIPLNLVDAPDVERSQRTRGLVYTATAAAIAHTAGVERVLIFENGYGAINPRLLEYQEGSQATKSTHPHVVRLLEDSYRAAGLACRIELPNLTRTKAELLGMVPEQLRDAIRLTVSCDSFPLRRKEYKQCGHCGSCVLRQQALREAGLASHDRRDYISSPFLGSKELRHAALMAAQAKRLSQLTDDFDRAVEQWPEIGLGSEAQLSLDRVAWIDMLRRYGSEWERILANDNGLADLLGWTAIYD